MATIDDILKDLGVDDVSDKVSNEPEHIEEKTASVQTTEGERMNLQDFYNDYFEEEVAQGQNADLEKNAAAENMELGALAGEFFNEKIASILDEVVMLKLAEDGVADSAASQDAQKGPGVVPSGNVVDAKVQLPVNRPADADKPMDTTPEYYDLLDAAVAKKKVEKAIEKADPQAEGVSFKTVQVDSGLETPKKQTV